jgi:hypothetical protein
MQPVATFITQVHQELFVVNTQGASSKGFKRNILSLRVGSYQNLWLQTGMQHEES